MKNVLLLMLAAFVIPSGNAQEGDALVKRGKELFDAPASCWACHGDQGEGRVGPSLQFGPSPSDISYQFQNNPQMGPLAAMLTPTADDLLALAVYIKTLDGTAVTSNEIDEFRSTLDDIQVVQEYTGFPLSAYDRKVQEIERFSTVLDEWERKSQTGDIRHDYETQLVASFDPGEPKFSPEPGKTYFYENTGTSRTTFVSEDGSPVGADSAQVVVGDAETKEVIAHYQLPFELRGGVHTTALSPDGKYVYIIGSRPAASVGALPSDPMGLLSAATLIKVDALTLQPVKQIVIGGRIHHAQVYKDQYLLIDTFGRDPDGLDVFLYDPETDQIIGGVRDEELGGSTYVSFSDGEYIYILMEPAGYSALAYTGYLGAMDLARGKFNAMRPFWITKIDPRTWEVVQEYPYPGYRGDWICFDGAKENMYVPAGGSGNISKINIETGNIEWTSPTGTGPYGCSLNAEQTEVWVADKGETTGMFGRTVSIVDAQDGRQLQTLMSGYQVDHVLLAPNGKEFWLTSNGEGRIYVYRAKDYELTNVIDMPDFGDAHGLVWVHYDEEGNAAVVADQGGFHNGIDPLKGQSLDY
jgi:DNA-binding beta-propeller fold protein YncE/cytochrome c553